MKNTVFIFFKLFITIGLFFVLFPHIDTDNVFSALKKIDVKFYFYAIAIALIQMLLGIFRWKVILHHMGEQIDNLILTKVYWIGLFFNQVLPSSIGGDGFKCYYLCQEGNKFNKVILSIIIDRIVGIVGLALLSMIVCMFFLGRTNTSAIFDQVVAVWGIVYFLLCVFFLFDKVMYRYENIKIIRWANTIAYNGRKIIISVNPGLKLLIISVTIHALNVLIFLLLAKGSGIYYLWESFVFVVPVATLIMSIPISIAGWGVREGVLVLGLSYTGVQNEVSLAISIIFGLLIFISSLPGGLLWLIYKKKTY